jgi:preprotein translocase subunit SecE
VQSTHRYVVFAFLFGGIILWVTLGRLLSAIALGTGLPDPAVLGEQITLTSLLGMAIAIGGGLYAYRHPKLSPFLNDVMAELFKCTWPSKKETRTATIVVIVTALVVAVILGLFDAVWAELTGLIYRAPTKG